MSNQEFVASKKYVCDACFMSLHHWHDGDDVKFLAVCAINSHQHLDNMHKKCESQYHGHWGIDHHPDI